MFKDASIARFHYEFDKDYKLLSYNLHWFPCPFSSEFLSQFLDEDRKIEKFLFEYLDYIEEVDSFNYTNFSFRTPIRIDYDANYKGLKEVFILPLIFIFKIQILELRIKIYIVCIGFRIYN